MINLANMLDAFLIIPYRVPENPIIGWWIGTRILCVWSTILGEISLFMAFKANSLHIRKTEKEVIRRQNQSISALKAGDKKAYKAINSLANEAFGKTFFIQVAMACASLWPAAFAL